MKQTKAVRFAILPGGWNDVAEKRLHIVANKMKEDQWITRTWHTLCGKPLQTGEVGDADLPLCRTCLTAACPKLKQFALRRTTDGPTAARLMIPGPIKQPKSLPGQRSFNGAVWDGKKWILKDINQSERKANG